MNHSQKKYTKWIWRIKKLLTKANMLKGKYLHTLCTAKREIYSIGGIDGSYSADCQKYSVTKNKWMSLPNLQIIRAYCAAFSFNNNEVYVLGGHNRTDVVNTMEKINAANPIKWEFATIINKYNGSIAIHAIQINSNEVIVFGYGSNDAK